MIGYKNEFFEIIESAGRDPKKRYKLWKCLCKCGNYTVLDTHSITAKRIKSCGCSRKGLNKGNTFGIKHGLTKYKIRAHPLYDLRNRIITRCFNPKAKDYPYYGGKGIKVCDEWINNPKSLMEWAFSKGWKKGLVIDRIDPSGDYSPENCQFLTPSENTKKMHRDKNIYPKKKVTKSIEYCYRCKCTADSDGLCKLRK